MSAPTPNAELAYRVLDHIDAHPEDWWQRSWISKPNGEDCGTAGCFAGWACMLFGDAPVWYWDATEITDMVKPVGLSIELYVGERAADLLRIAEADADLLFNESNTREDIGRLVAELFGPRPGGESS